jgi:predicted neuraminidase
MWKTRTICAFFAILVTLNCLDLGIAAEPQMTSELIFPLHDKHNHAPGIAECPNGDLIVSWYRGSGERQADDVAVFGARLRNGQSKWSDAFLWVDTPGFPDCNTCLMMDSDNRLWLFWPVIIANTWESCITHYVTSTDYLNDGSPKTSTNGIVLLKPADFMQTAMERWDVYKGNLPSDLTDRQKREVSEFTERLGDRLYQRLGWQPRCKPTVLPSGRILLPLYSDTYSFSMMAISDDKGASWFASEPLIGFGNIQPVVLRRKDGTLFAFMRENGPRERIRVAESKDDGMSWGKVYDSDLPNPGAGVDGMVLQSGKWLMIYNDTTDGRNSLAVSLSEDEGRTWKWTRHLEHHESGSYHYPAVIQGKDGMVHFVYSYFVAGGKSMKHVAANEAWLMEQ